MSLGAKGLRIKILAYVPCGFEGSWHTMVRNYLGDSEGSGSGASK
jgi:hypothetical protein